jgi:diguanylate cyclase (GGDEF)-like protein
MKTIFNILDKRKPRFIWLLSVFAITFIGVVIYLEKDNVDLRPLFVIPVLLASWYGGRKTGTTMAVLTTIALLATNYSLGFYEINNDSVAYDILVNLFVYFFISIIVTNFKRVHGVEKDAADTDTLTGANSSRKFYLELANEIVRSRRYRHTFSMAYIDVDNFKIINDTLGHPIGDELLIRVSECLLQSLRATDVVARLGGDEFVCLLPETEQGEAKTALLKAEKTLKGSMEKYGWDVSFSVGVVTFETLPNDVGQAVKLADDLMYQVKSGNKNDIAYRVWCGIA